MPSSVGTLCSVGRLRSMECGVLDPRGTTPYSGSELILKKSDTTPEGLFHGFPHEFASSLSYVKSLPPGKKGPRGTIPYDQKMDLFSGLGGRKLKFWLRLRLRLPIGPVSANRQNRQP